jgi:hypothetical protein
LTGLLKKRQKEEERQDMRGKKNFQGKTKCMEITKEVTEPEESQVKIREKRR